MKVAIYHLYLDILGGGEKYTFDMADFFIKRGDKVDFFWSDKTLSEKIRERYNLRTDRINFIPIIFQRRKNLLKRLITLHRYDVFFYVTDGSLFFSNAKKSILIIQSPAHIPQKDLINRFKIKFWQLILCYSDYVKKYIRETWLTNTLILPPAVAIDQFKPLKKENLILSVGRFTQSLHTKKQEVLMNAFKKLSKKNMNLKLVLAGGLLNDDRSYFEKLKKQSGGYNIELYANVDFNKLKELYGKAKIYWHAAGFGEDLKKYPEKAEHFGITTVEAMAAGCLPVVFKAGGQLEIVDEDRNGFFWETEEELIVKTEKIIKNYDNYEDLINNAILRSRDFSKAAFEENLKKILCL